MILLAFDVSLVQVYVSLLTLPARPLAPCLSSQSQAQPLPFLASSHLLDYQSRLAQNESFVLPRWGLF